MRMLSRLQRIHHVINFTPQLLDTTTRSCIDSKTNIHVARKLLQHQAGLYVTRVFENISSRNKLFTTLYIPLYATGDNRQTGDERA